MDRHLRRKWTFRAHRKQVTFIKNSSESPEHVFMKAFLWALYLPKYPDLAVEIRIGDRFKPDVVSMDESEPDRRRPLFWGESGKVGQRKIKSLVRRYRDTHFAMAKWDAGLDPFVTLVKKAMKGIRRSAPFDLIRFPADSAERFIDARGVIRVRHLDVDWKRL